MFQSVDIDTIKIGERMRKLDMNKVHELVDSFRHCGQLNPVTIDTEHNLIAGNHRVNAGKMLGWKKIDANVLDSDELIKQLQELDENLMVNSIHQCFISTGEHIAKRERILTALGRRRKRGDNRYTIDDNDDVFSTDALAQKIGVSNRVYRLRRQVSNLIPSVRNALRGTPLSNNLVDLVILSRMEDDIQERVAELAKDSNSKSLRRMIDTAKIEKHTDKDRTELVKNLKEKYGVPYSIMKFDREDHVLQKIVKKVADNYENKRNGHLRGREVGNYNGFPDHSVFLLDYYVRHKNAKVLDNFMGTGVNMMAGLFLNMEVVGFDLNPKLCDLIYETCDECFPDGKYEFFNEDGIEMKPLKDKEEYFHAICADPPYIGAADAYTESPEDLSNVSNERFYELMEVCFENYYRLIKTSNVAEKRFYPVMMKMNSSRSRSQGVLSMDFEIAKIAEKFKFNLWDRTFNVINPTNAPVIVPRCYEYCYSVKNWETTLVFIKQ